MITSDPLIIGVCVIYTRARCLFLAVTIRHKIRVITEFEKSLSNKFKNYFEN
jgi:hypothetical protein